LPAQRRSQVKQSPRLHRGYQELGAFDDKKMVLDSTRRQPSLKKKEPPEGGSSEG
jgi:hypothetical protein